MISTNMNFAKHHKAVGSGKTLIQLDVVNLEDKSIPSIISAHKTNGSTQTDFEDVFQTNDSKVAGKLEEFDQQNGYKEILEKKNMLISDLSNEKDFLWHEIQFLRDKYSLPERKNDEFEWNSEWGYSSLNSNAKHRSLKENNGPMDSHEKELLLCSIMSLRKQALQQQYQKDKQAVLDKVEIEKDLIRDEISTEFEQRYSEEITKLTEKITSLKEELELMKIQKDDLGKIFEGERNALELQFLRREKELKNKMARDFQRELIRAHQDWSKSEV